MTDTNYEPKALTFKEQAVLEQVRRHYAVTKVAFDTLERKAQTALSVSSIAITIITGFRVIGSQSGQNNGLVAVFLLYLLILVFALAALMPVDRVSEPVGARWDIIKESLEQPDDDFYYSLLSGYEDAVSHNRRINLIKSRLVLGEFVLMCGMVVTAMIMALGTI